VLEHPLKHFERGKGLVKGHFVARLVDAHKREETGLFDLAVYDGVAGRDVGEAGVAVARGGD
jgi:hypothetical protein